MKKKSNFLVGSLIAAFLSVMPDGAQKSMNLMRGHGQALNRVEKKPDPTLKEKLRSKRLPKMQRRHSVYARSLIGNYYIPKFLSN